MANVVCFGSGNLASHLLPALKSKGHEIVQIYSRTRKHAKRLADVLECSATTSLNKINADAEIYLFCVSDAAIAAIVGSLKLRLTEYQYAFHCSGTTNANVLKPLGDNYGVTWPIQTFSKEVTIKMTSIPFCLTANNKATEKVAKQLFKGIGKMNMVTDDQRRQLHLGAVIVNNFTNHLFHLTDNFLSSNALNFDLLYPLIEETIRKSKNNKAENSQTGPAIRKDTGTTKRHLQLLKNDSSLKSIYQLITKSIQEQSS